MVWQLSPRLCAIGNAFGMAAAQLMMPAKAAALAVFFIFAVMIRSVLRVRVLLVLSIELWDMLSNERGLLS